MNFDSPELFIIYINKYFIGKYLNDILSLLNFLQAAVMANNYNFDKMKKI